MWYSQLPDWVTAGDFNATELAAIVENHTSTVVAHYAGQVYVDISYLDTYALLTLILKCADVSNDTYNMCTEFITLTAIYRQLGCNQRSV